MAAERLFQRAGADLQVRVANAPADTLIWEHAQRVTRLARAVASMPEVDRERLDLIALDIASLYHEAGWVLQCHAGRVGTNELLLRPTSDILRELAADWMAERVKDLCPPASVQLAAHAIRSANDRETDLLEARVLAEADNLDQIGPHAICLMLRKQRAEGKTLDDVVSAWERQEEYHYWEARLKESFRFPSVRALAERRLDALRRFMADMQACLTLQDVREYLDASPAVSADRVSF